MDFFVDTNPSEDSESVKPIANLFPLFKNSKLSLRNEPVSEKDDGEDEDYYGKQNHQKNYLF